ncbi:MAG: S8/S53 family peptidase [Thermoplasmatota archaeon]
MRLVFGVAALLLVPLALSAIPASPVVSDTGDRHGPFVTIAHIDEGVNPYNINFRDDSPLGYTPPWLYIPGYPVNTPALRLHLNETDWQTAFNLDKGTWLNVTPKTLYWIPGTKIIGGISFGPGGTDCPFLPTQIPPTGALQSTSCHDYPILDDGGHGTMTASRSAGLYTSLCPQCRFVTVEGLGADSVTWVANQDWIDVQTNSWLDLVPPPANQAQQLIDDNDPTGIAESQIFGNATSNAASYAAHRMPTFFASGNGAAYIMGAAPTPTYALSTAVPGVILVGAHDNGFVTTWGGAPAHVVADGYGGPRANRTSITDISPDPISCCTSAASPYAAGGGAEIILAAREILHDTGGHLHGSGILARADDPEHCPTTGPLADCIFTLDEFKAVLFHTAEARPQQGVHDGLVNWFATPTNGPSPYVTQYGPGANPFCLFCVTAPVQWKDVPADVPAYTDIGYGAINERSVALAEQVLAGHVALPTRIAEDEWYAADQAAREVIFPGL